MRVNKWLAAAIFGWVLLWVGSLLLYDAKQVAKPIFFSHYYDVYPDDNLYTFSLYYLTNVTDQRQVTDIDLPDRTYPVFVDDRQITHRTNYHQIRQLDIRMDREPVRQDSWDVIEVRYSDGTWDEVDIGEITLHKQYPHHEWLDWISGSSSSNHTGSDTYRAREHLQVTGIRFDSPWPADFFHMQINGQSLSDTQFPLTLGKNETLTVQYAFDTSADVVSALHFYDLDADILVEDGAGKSEIIPLHIDYRPNLTDERIGQFVEERR
ncbi:hypothetical protein LOK74_07255 [Brevibacillus humidisoli]|uniref:hypothetical protein n=1 Tax=Brevibacillus humidisoli TaxID=2895522 RepID=UPI001E2E86C2|nr:hypothetical protein [Brevibacillus humidisoli]UFJ42281.1 hypothetical protein LOK74_07255 [Brevibacillus humidisoli]